MATYLVLLKSTNLRIVERYFCLAMQTTTFQTKNLTSRAKTFLMVSHFETDSHSPAVHLSFEWTGKLFERLELSVLNNSSSVRTVRAIRSRKLISCLNDSSYLFEKNHQPFEQLAIRSKNSSAVRIAQAIRSRNSSAVRMAQAIHSRNSQPFQQDKTRHALLNDACCYVYITQTVVTFLFFVYLRLILNKIISFSRLFPGKK